MQMDFPALAVDSVRDHPALQAMHDSGTLINVYKMMLGSPSAADALARFGATLFTGTALSDQDRELVILTVASIFESDYEAQQHLQLSNRAGVTQQQRLAILRHDWSADCFSDRQIQLLTFVEAAAAHPTVADDAIPGLRNAFSDRQLIDVVLVVGAYFLIARMSTIFEVATDPPVHDLLAVARQGTLPPTGQSPRHPD